jgi:hypothetical protein
MATKKKKKPDATRCGLCGAMCANATEVSRHHRDTCSRHPDNRPKKLKPDEVAEALGASSHEPSRGMNSYLDGRKSVPLFDKKTGMPWEHTHEVSGGSSHCMACIVEGTAPREGGQQWIPWIQELIGKLGFSPRYPGVTDEQHLVELVGTRWAEDAKQKWVVNWTVDGYLDRRPHLKNERHVGGNRRAHDNIPHCSNTNDKGVCMYVGPCLECSSNRARMKGHCSWPAWIDAFLKLLNYDRARDQTLDMPLDVYLSLRGIDQDAAYNAWARFTTPEQYVRDNPKLRGRGYHPLPRWVVFVSKRGVHLQIDHQSFMLKDDYDPEDGWTKEAYFKWYAKQLTIAFKRLMGESQ